MDADERQRKLRILAAYKRRRDELEHQAAVRGLNTDPALNIEIEQLEEKIEVLEEKLGAADSRKPEVVHKHQQDSSSYIVTSPAIFLISLATFSLLGFVLFQTQTDIRSINFSVVLFVISLVWMLFVLMARIMQR